jgi:ABC-type ATPase with predicted acetyltransferase domain
MRSLMIILAMMISIVSIEAQVTLEAKTITTVTNNKRKVEQQESKIVINADTTEVELFLDKAYVKDEIKELFSSFDEGTYKILIYKLKNDELLVLHIDNDILFCVVYQSSNSYSVEYK